MFDDSLVKKLSRYTNSDNYTLDGSKLIVDKFFELYPESEQLVEGAMHELKLEIEGFDDYDSWVKSIKDQIESKQEDIKNCEKDNKDKPGLDKDDIEDMKKDLQAEIDELQNKLKVAEENKNFLFND